MNQFDRFLRGVGAASIAYAGTTALMAADVELPKSVLDADAAASGSGGGAVILVLAIAIVGGLIFLKKKHPQVFKRVTDKATNVVNQATDLVHSQPSAPVAPAQPQPHDAGATAPQPAPVAVVPAAPVYAPPAPPALVVAATPRDSYIDRDDLIRDTVARNIQYQILIDGKIVNNGFTPGTLFYTWSDGSVRKTIQDLGFSPPQPPEPVTAPPLPHPAPPAPPAPVPAPPAVEVFPQTIYDGTPGQTGTFMTVANAAQKAVILRAFGSDAQCLPGYPVPVMPPPSAPSAPAVAGDPWSGSSWPRLALVHITDASTLAWYANPHGGGGIDINSKIDQFNSFPDGKEQWKKAQGNLGGTWKNAAQHLRNIAIGQFPHLSNEITVMVQIVEQANQRQEPY